jgi:Na+/H+-dicarboxylate symporter
LIANDFCLWKQVCLMMILGIFLGIFSKAEIIFSHSLFFDFRLLFERGI